MRKIKKLRRSLTDINKAIALLNKKRLDIANQLADYGDLRALDELYPPTIKIMD